MYHIATHNKGLGSYNDDFNRLVKDLFNEGPLKLHFMIATYTQVLTNNANRQQKKTCDTIRVYHQKLFKAKARPSPIE